MPSFITALILFCLPPPPHLLLLDHFRRTISVLNLVPGGSGLHYSRWLTRRKTAPGITIPVTLLQSLNFVNSGKTRLELRDDSHEPEVDTEMQGVKPSPTSDAGPQGAVEWGWAWEGVACFPWMWCSQEVWGTLLAAHFISWKPDCWEKKFFSPLAS